jgi:hypothetical protein
MSWEYYKGREHERNAIRKELVKVMDSPEKLIDFIKHL